MSRKKISTTIYVTPEQNEQLKLLHARTKVPVAVFIREGIDLVLLRHAHLLPGQLQLTASSAHSEPIRLDSVSSESGSGRGIVATAPGTNLLGNQETPAAAGDRGK
jgi:hypothetical protein